MSDWQLGMTETTVQTLVKRKMVQMVEKDLQT